jgi:hypothetical protein
MTKDEAQRRRWTFYEAVKLVLALALLLTEPVMQEGLAGFQDTERSLPAWLLEVDLVDFRLPREGKVNHSLSLTPIQPFILCASAGREKLPLVYSPFSTPKMPF